MPSTHTKETSKKSIHYLNHKPGTRKQTCSPTRITGLRRWDFELSLFIYGAEEIKCQMKW